MWEVLKESERASNAVNSADGVGASRAVTDNTRDELQRGQAASSGCVAEGKTFDEPAPTMTNRADTGPFYTDQGLLNSSTKDSPTYIESRGSQSDEFASSVPGLLPNCAARLQLEASCPRAPEYVNCCPQYAEQAVRWCEQGKTISTEPKNDLLPLRDSKRELIQQWLTRPARRQALASDIENISHWEGQNEYNIWYGRHLTDRYNRPSHLDREAASYRCDPELDAGYTAADTHPGNSEAYFCAFFAKGCCTKGSDCRYKHRVPTLQDECMLEWSRDVFGRERHRDHRDDMGGAGSFNHECKTLFVGGLQVDPLEEDGIQGLEKFLWEAFGVWGDVQSVRVIPKKLIGFVTFAYRVQAEFAKVAMADQNFGKHGPLLSVKWAHQDGNANRKNGNGEQNKKQKIGGVGAPTQGRQTEQRGEDVVLQALDSYCSAWQAYWAALCEADKPTHDSPLNQQHRLVTSSAHLPTFGPRVTALGWQHNSSGFGDAVSPLPSEERNIGCDNAQRLLSVLNRVEGLSTSDFLKAGGLGSSGL